MLGLLGDIVATFAVFDFMILQDESGCVSVEGEGRREYIQGEKRTGGEEEREREGGGREGEKADSAR